MATLVIEPERAQVYMPNPERFTYKTQKGLSRRVVEEISWQKDEPDWMRQRRLRAYEIFEKKPLPTWGPDLSGLNFDEITFYVRAEDLKTRRWEDVPEDIRRTYERIGIPEAERKFLAGVVAQYESENFYENLKKDFEAKGIIFCGTDTAVQKYPDLVKEYFMTRCVPPSDNKFAALHGAVWSGGSFVYVTEGVHVDIPLQAYFRMNSEQFGQFEHTLIIVERGASVSYIEGCTAPLYSTSSLHSAVVEIFVKEGARARYTTVQNWAKNVYNLNTKRSLVLGEGATMEWVGGSMGSGVTMLYPCSILRGKGSRADHLNIAFAGRGQHKDTGAKVIHVAPYTTSTIVSKSISKDGGWTGYRGLVRIHEGAVGAKVNVRCDALLLDEISRSDTLPYMQIHQNKVSIGHEATVGRVSDEQLFYLMSRGLTESEAMAMIVSGFIEPVTKELPMEYAVELNRLIQLEMEGSVG